MIDAAPIYPAVLASAGLRIRRATAGDLPEIRRLQADALRSAAIRLHGAELEETLPRLDVLEPEPSEAGGFFIAEIEGEPVACGGWSWRAPAGGGEGIELPAKDGRAVCRVHGFCVHPLFIRHGIGATLMARIDRDMRASGVVRAQAAIAFGAVGFFAGRGWQSRGAVFGMLDGGMVFLGVQMEKRLPAASYQAA
ncbi:GNAT family N-acetyltransferase [Ancylobacter lacus]|uniref:GNAT family N-acetyltransferase n=1 Tax=Ancylobacter lacus TaxID=2579970 RepID=UPI001BCCA1CC|nr:GNAT family N-acetyltransferase [Ancylobacter lacus]MBS7541100.1 GNAT family N-acetyltransferase [Ancylobacter lacus]